MTHIELTLLLAAIGLIPALLPQVPAPEGSRLYPRIDALRREAHLPTALLAGASFLVREGAVALALVLPYLAVLALHALAGLIRLRWRGLHRPGPTLIDLGHLYLPVGGVWLGLSRFGARPLGFGEPIVLLTAVHFHFAGFLLPVLAGLLDRRLGLSRPPRWRAAFRAAAAAIGLGVPLLALGIGFSPPLEWGSVLLLALGAILLGACALRGISRARLPEAGRALLSLSALCLMAAAGFALAYGWGEIAGLATLTIPEMLRTHGALNAYGFALLGALGLRAARAAAAPADEGSLLEPSIPFSRLRASGRVGADFFDRVGAAPGARGASSPVTGLVDRLEELGHAGFAAERVHPSVRSFYERTDAHDLVVAATWSRGFRSLSRAYGWIGEAFEQMNFPDAAAGSRVRPVRSRIFALADAADGRSRVRAWVRSYADSGQAIYAAAYSRHERGGVPYMNIAFPHWRANLTSVLRAAPLGEGLLLTTLPGDEPGGDQGVFWVTRWLPIRLPLNETIEVWPASDPRAPEELKRLSGGPTVVARHRVWLFGILFLRLDYAIRANLPILGE